MLHLVWHPIYAITHSNWVTSSIFKEMQLLLLKCLVACHVGIRRYAVVSACLVHAVVMATGDGQLPVVVNTS